MIVLASDLMAIPDYNRSVSGKTTRLISTYNPSPEDLIDRHVLTEHTSNTMEK